MVLQFRNVSKSYSTDEIALRELSFSIEPGEFTALAGPSGSGKTTILNLCAGLDRATGGKILLLGRDLSKLSPKENSELRRDFLGFIFQAYNLFPVLTALENVEYPLALKGVAPRERRRRSEEALADVGMSGFGRRFPSQLSGGQQQRVAIARAIVTAPQVVFADEPTANVDSETAERLLRLFQQLNASRKITFLFSSHDSKVLNIATRVLEICDGKIKQDSRKSHVIAPIASTAQSVVSVDPDTLDLAA